MSYTVEIASAASRLVKKLPKRVRQVIVDHSVKLADRPLIGEKLKGKYSFLYSYHLIDKGTHYRIIYEVSHKERRVLIRLAATRENIYRRLKEMGVKPLLHQPL